MSVSAHSGLFVVLEGIDGAGKTEQLERLERRLAAAGVAVVATREPTDGPWGRRYRAWARGEIEGGPEEVLELFLADRDEHVREVIQPALAAGGLVLCDRYVASTRAYQVAAGIPRDRLEQILRAHPVPRPDLSLWLRIPVPTALARLGRARERFEKQAFLEQVDTEYQRLQRLGEAGGEGDWPLIAVDASAEPESVEQRLFELILAGFEEERHRPRPRRESPVP